MHLLTALALLVMAAGLWFGGPAVSVPAPRLQASEARVAAALESPAPAPAEPDEPVATPGSAVVSPAPVVGYVAIEPAGVALSVAGPRAPPVI